MAGEREHARAPQADDLGWVGRGERVNLDGMAAATAARTGQSFTAPSIQVFRIREGRIAVFRDFANNRILEDVIGEPAAEG